MLTQYMFFKIPNILDVVGDNIHHHKTNISDTLCGIFYGHCQDKDQQDIKTVGLECSYHLYSEKRTTEQ